jgi:DNA-binding PadR family transcriptional regulator
MPKSNHLSDFELFVMLAIAALGDDAYGVSIANRISERADRDVSIGAVYATLGRLSDRGLVTFSFSDPEPVRGGRARKLVTLTPAGSRALHTTANSVYRMLDGVVLRPATGERR